MQPDRQVALRSGANGMADGVTYVTYVSSAASITNAAPSPMGTSRLSLARESTPHLAAETQDTPPRSDVPTRPLSGVLGHMSIPPLLIGLGLLWLLVVCGLTLNLILRSTWRANPHRLRARQDHALTNNPVAVVVAAPSRRPKEIQSEVVQPSTAVGYNGGAFDTTPYRLPSADARHWPSSMDSPAMGLSSGVTAQAAWCTVARQGTDDGYQARRDATFVETDLKLTGGGSSAFGLFLVADGRSSGRAHLTASSTAVRTIARRVIPAMIGRPAVPPHLLLPLLKYAVIQAGDALLAQNAIAGTDTCTTVTGALVAGGRAYIVNVGNSRTYFYNARDGLWQITKDHSVLSGMVSAGFVGSRALDMPSHAQQLYRSLGDANRPIRVDTFEMPVLHPGDRLLLCSDGLWREVPDSRIETILRTTADPRLAAQVLIKEASGGSSSIRDDISAIVVRIGDGGARGGGEVHAAEEGGEALRSAL